MAGNAGHGAGAEVARNLARVLDVPEDQARSFLQHGEAHAVKNLHRALQGMPGTDLRDAATASTPAPSVRPELLMRLRGLNTLKSSYNGDFGGRDEQRRREASLQALGSLVRQDYRKHFNEWQGGAAQRDLDALADACRSLRSASAQRVTTTYGKMCGERCDSAAAEAAAKASPTPQPQRRNARNHSMAVPLGSIYREPNPEMVQMRAKFSALEVEAARTHIGELRSGRLPGQRMGTPHYDVPHQASSAMVKGCFIDPSPEGSTKSLSQSSYHLGVYKKGNTELYGHRSVVRGEKAWQDCKHDVAFAKGVHSWPKGLAASRSAPQLG